MRLYCFDCVYLLCSWRGSAGAGAHVCFRFFAKHHICLLYVCFGFLNYIIIVSSCLLLLLRFFFLARERVRRCARKGAGRRGEASQPGNRLRKGSLFALRTCMGSNPEFNDFRDSLRSAKAALQQNTTCDMPLTLEPRDRERGRERERERERADSFLVPWEESRIQLGGGLREYCPPLADPPAPSREQLHVPENGAPREPTAYAQSPY